MDAINQEDLSHGFHKAGGHLKKKKKARILPALSYKLQGIHLVTWQLRRHNQPSCTQPGIEGAELYTERQASVKAMTVR